MTLSWKTAGLQVNTTTLANSQIRILVRGSRKEGRIFFPHWASPALDKMLTHELPTSKEPRTEPTRMLSTMTPEHWPGQQALHGGYIASVHHLGGNSK